MEKVLSFPSRMKTHWRRMLTHSLLGTAGMLLACCAGISSNARQMQAIDGLTGSRNLATAAFRATVISAIRQPITTTKLGIAVFWNRPKEIIAGNVPATMVTRLPSPYAPGSQAFERMLDDNHFPAREFGTIRWFVDGPQFFPELDRQIAAARHSIDCQIFIFDNDDIGVRYADLLKQRSEQLRVRVLFDDFGSYTSYSAAPKTLGPRGFTPPADMHGYLRDQSRTNVRRTLNPWLVADHTKLFVFDDRFAFLGGMNIGREYYSEWHDLMIRVEGPVVRSLSRDFTQAWRKAGPFGDFARRRKPIDQRDQPGTADDIPLRVLRTDPADGRYEIRDAMLWAIHGSKNRVWIETPYFANDSIVQAILDAARRGVDVRIIIPSNGDSPLMAANNLASARQIMLAGGKVFRYHKMTHVKAMICDDWATVGSANLDTLSMCINRELNLAFSDPRAVRALEEKIFLPDQRRSTKILPSEMKKITEGIAEVIADQL